MSASADGWIPLDEATGAFERPAWAIRALLEQGKLERKVEDGRVYVRKPVPPQTPADPTAIETLARSLGAFLSADSFAPGDAPPVVRAFPIERAAPAEESGWDDIRTDVDELMRKTRARDALLARAAQALLFVEAGMRQAAPALPAPTPRRSHTGLASALVLGCVLAGAVGAKLGLEAIAAERVQTGRALERAAAMRRAYIPGETLAPLGTTACVSFVGSSLTLPASFGR